MDGAHAIAGDEEALVRRARSDREAFGLLYDRYVDRLYRFAYRQTRDYSDAEDVTAETFRRAFEARQGFQPRGKPFGAWLFAIAANVLREHARARHARRPDQPVDDLRDEEEPTDDAPQAIDLVIRQEDAGSLWGLVRLLPLDMQRVLVLRYAWGLSYADIARRLGRSDVACKQLAYRALKALRVQAAMASRLDGTSPSADPRE